MNNILENKINLIKKNLEENNCDAIIINKSSDVFYYSGFDAVGDKATLLITNNKKFFITDGRFVNQFKKEVKGFHLVENKKLGDTYKIINCLIKEENIKSLIFNFEDLSFKNFKEFENNKIKYIDAGNLFKENRRVKNEEEIKIIKKACEINEKAFLDTLEQIKEGITEKELRNILNYELMKRGSEGFSFETIVGSGPNNSALPHAIPTDRKLEEGDLVVIDFGCSYKRYGADNTRTIAIGKISDELKRIYRTVLETKNECTALIKPGVNTKKVHNFAKNKLKEAGYSLDHGLGHGIGIDNHELPRMANSYESQFKENDVITVEPGVYLLGIGGARIEDDYIVTKNGVENLTPNITTELITI